MTKGGAGSRRGLASGLALAALAGCSPTPAVPEHPTWADVQPILRAECTSCHGGSAPTTGSARGVVYRLDFLDLTPETCGEAAAAVAPARFAAAASSQIAYDITSIDASIRPRMPPAPAAWLEEWKWQTLLRWTSDPQRGAAPSGNRPPTIRVLSAARKPSGYFLLSVVLDDPDGDSAVGVIRIGDDATGEGSRKSGGIVRLNMDRPGAFAIEIDPTPWVVVPPPIRATVCDGWSWASFTVTPP